MSEVKRLIDCFFRYKRLYEETRDLMYLVYMENIARDVGGEFYSWWRRVVPDYAGWWGLCDVELVGCEDLIKMAVACWPNVNKRLLRRCRGEELNYLFSGKYVC
jgi:hypothetical protein